jgi:RNA polymerase sigma-70 factor (ECF subfamily)
MTPSDTPCRLAPGLGAATAGQRRRDRIPRRPPPHTRMTEREDSSLTAPRLVYSAREPRARWSEISDLELLETLRGGSEQALDELVQRKTPALLQVAWRVLGDMEEARDVVQVAFLRMWEHRTRYDARWSPNTWIYRIVTNLAIDHLRSRKSRERNTEPYRRQLRQVETERGFSDLQAREVEGIFNELAHGLSEKQRLAFLLREVEGMSSQEVAAILECQESTVRNHLFNARKILQREVRLRYPEYAAAFAGAEAAP